jgi:hypothetical protein
MDGIVPVLYLMISVASVLSALSSGVLGVFIVLRPERIGKALVSFSKINLLVILIASLLALAAIKTIIGDTSLIYLAPLDAVLSCLVLIKIANIYKYNKSLKSDANRRAL